MTGSSSVSSCLVVYYAILTESVYDKSQYANNRAEQSHEPTRVRERVMRRFKSVGQAGAEVSGYPCSCFQFVQSREAPGQS